MDNITNYSPESKENNEFKYSEYLAGRITNRGHVLTLDEIKKIEETGSDKPAWAGLTCHGEDFRYHCEDLHLGVGEFSGVGVPRILAADFDSKSDLAQAWKDATIFVRHLQDHGVDEAAIRTYYSGSKGWHVVILTSALGEIIPCKTPHLITKAIVTRIVADAELQQGSTIDYQIFKTNQPFRLANSRNDKSGRFKIGFTIGEFFDPTLPFKVEGLAQQPRFLDYPDDDDIRIQPYLCDVTRMALKELQQTIQTPITEVPADVKALMDFAVRPCQRRMLIGVEEGRRVLVGHVLVSLFRESGFSSEHIEEILYKWNNLNKPRLTKKELIWLLHGKEYHYGCKHPIRQQFCDPTCPYYKRQRKIYFLPSKFIHFVEQISRDGNEIEPKRWDEKECYLKCYYETFREDRDSSLPDGVFHRKFPHGVRQRVIDSYTHKYLIKLWPEQRKSDLFYWKI
jgi:hypothetical protein